MRSHALWLCFLITVLSGCGSHSAGTLPTTESPDTPAPTVDDREATGLFGGRVTLNGSQTTSPAYKNQPYQIQVPAKAGELALITLRATAIPVAPSNLVRVRCQGPSQTYFTRILSANGTTFRVPVYASTIQTLTLTFYNSTGVTLNKEAVEWTWSITTTLAEGVGEPDDDENAATITDRTSARPISLGQQSSGSFYQATIGPKDREDWYKITLDGCQLVTWTFTNSSSTWGPWLYALKVYDGVGQSLGVESEVSTDSATFQTRLGPGRQTYFLQVSGIPNNPQAANAQYASYTVRATAAPSPSLPPVSEAGRRLGNTGSIGSTSGLGMCIFEGRLAITYQQYGSPRPLLLARAKVPAPAEAADWVVSEIGPMLSLDRPTSMVEHGGRLVLCNTNDTGPPYMIVKAATKPHPEGPSDWVSYTMPNLGRHTAAGMLFKLNGGVAMGYWQLYDGYIERRFAHARGTSTPLQSIDWQIHTLPVSVSHYAHMLYGGQLVGRPVLLGMNKPVLASQNYDLLLSVATTPNPATAGDWNQFVLASDLYAEPQAFAVSGDRLCVAYDTEQRSRWLARSTTAFPAGPGDFSHTVVESKVELDYPYALFAGTNHLTLITGVFGIPGPVRVARSGNLDPSGASDWTWDELDPAGETALFPGWAAAPNGLAYVLYPGYVSEVGDQPVRLATFDLACGP